MPQITPQSIDEFLSLVNRSGLVSQEPLAAAVAEFRQNHQAVTPQQGAIASLGAFLVSRGLLTHWQCEKLLKGRYKGFFLDQYQILEHLSYDNNYNYYRATDTSNNKQVILRIHPPNAQWCGKIEYDLEDPLE